MALSLPKTLFFFLCFIAVMEVNRLHHAIVQTTAELDSVSKIRHFTKEVHEIE